MKNLVLTTDILKIKNRIGLEKLRHNTVTSGLDNPKECMDKDHFQNYPKKISYKYNANGFRDHAWPEDLSDVIWCVGDSFTVGIGQPFEETWPQILEKKILKRCLNIGEDACSNDTIALRALEIYKIYKPKLIIIMWSYFHRRRVNNQNVYSDKTNFGSKQDIENFAKNFLIVDNLPIKKIHLTVPNALPDSNKCSKKEFDYILSKFDFLDQTQINKINIFKQLDYARDYHHFDIKTSELVTDLIIEKIKDLDN